MMPAALAPSFEPLAKAMEADVAHSPPRTGRRTRRVARRNPIWAPRVPTSPTAKPITGEMVRASRKPSTPTGCQPSSPPQYTAFQPPCSTAAPTSPPTRA